MRQLEHETRKRNTSINLPKWMDAAVRELAQQHKRSLSGEIEFLVEEAIKNTATADAEPRPAA